MKCTELGCHCAYSGIYVYGSNYVYIVYKACHVSLIPVVLLLVEKFYVFFLFEVHYGEVQYEEVHVHVYCGEVRGIPRRSGEVHHSVVVVFLLVAIGYSCVCSLLVSLLPPTSLPPSVSPEPYCIP